LLRLLQTEAVPLADLVTSTCLARFDRDMKYIDGKFNALDAVAPLIATMPVHDVGRRAAVVVAEPSANPVRSHPYTAYARNGNTLRG
jgi:hypothetical protein